MAEIKNLMSEKAGFYYYSQPTDLLGKGLKRKAFKPGTGSVVEYLLMEKVQKAYVLKRRRWIY